MSHTGHGLLLVCGKSSSWNPPKQRVGLVDSGDVLQASLILTIVFSGYLST
jgi:hypothetical protein